MLRHLLLIMGALFIGKSSAAQIRFVLPSRSNICNFNKSPDSTDIYTWDPNDQTLEYLTKICKTHSIDPDEFVLRGANVDNALAFVDTSNRRIIFYSKAFFASLSKEAFKVAVLAHEIGHHINNDLLSKNGRRASDELRADRFAGNVLCKLGYHLDDAKELLNQQCPTQGEGYYPPRSARIEAMITGFQDAGCNTSSVIFDQTFNSPDFRLTIDKTNSFTYKEFSIDKLDIRKDFDLKFNIESYRKQGSVRCGIGWNFNSDNDFLLFTIHTINSGYYSIGPGNNPTYPPYSRFKEGSIVLHNFGDPDQLELKKIGLDLIFLINDAEVWRTQTFKLVSNAFAFWAADNSDAALVKCTATQ